MYSLKAAVEFIVMPATGNVSDVLLAERGNLGREKLTPAQGARGADE
jgi:hypothetical protein